MVYMTTIVNIFFYIDRYYYGFYCDKSFQYQTNIIDDSMSKTLLSNDKNQENKQFRIFETLSEQQEKEKEFIILKSINLR